jgi:hypothetical protein
LPLWVGIGREARRGAVQKVGTAWPQLIPLGPAAR